MKRRKSAAGVGGTEAVRHLAGRDSERREQVEDAVPLVVVRVAHRPTRPQRQGRLRSFQRLNRGLLVDAEHDRVVGRVEVESDDIADLGGEGRVATDLVRPHQMRLQAVRAQDVGDAATGAATTRASNRVVQRLRPAGGGDNANWRICSTVSAGTAWSRRPAFG